MTALVFVVVEQAIVTVVWCFWLFSEGSMAVMIAELLFGLPQKLALEVNVPVAMPFEPTFVSCVHAETRSSGARLDAEAHLVRA